MTLFFCVLKPGFRDACGMSSRSIYGNPCGKIISSNTKQTKNRICMENSVKRRGRWNKTLG